MRSVLAVNTQQLFVANDRRTVGIAHSSQSQRMNFLRCNDRLAVAGMQKPIQSVRDTVNTTAARATMHTISLRRRTSVSPS